MGLAEVKIADECLIKELKYPINTQVINGYYNVTDKMLYLIVSHPDIRPSKEGLTVRHLTPVITYHPARFEFDWNQR